MIALRSSPSRLHSHQERRQCPLCLRRGCCLCQDTSPYFQELLTAVGSFGRGYSAPSMKKLRTSMLVKRWRT